MLLREVFFRRLCKPGGLTHSASLSCHPRGFGYTTAMTLGAADSTPK